MDGERSGLFFEIVRLAKEIQPTFIFLENVPAITTRGGLRVVREITEMGYDCRWCVISAASVGALHKRERWFLLAHAGFERLEGLGNGTIGTEQKVAMSSGSSEIPYAGCEYKRGEKESEWTPENYSGYSGFWETEPDVGKLADGVQNRVDKLRAVGNAVVPQQARKAFQILSGIIEKKGDL